MNVSGLLVGCCDVISWLVCCFLFVVFVCCCRILLSMVVLVRILVVVCVSWCCWLVVWWWIFVWCVSLVIGSWGIVWIVMGLVLGKLIYYVVVRCCVLVVCVVGWWWVMLGLVGWVVCRFRGCCWWRWRIGMVLVFRIVSSVCVRWCYWLFFCVGVSLVRVVVVVRGFREMWWLVGIVRCCCRDRCGYCCSGCCFSWWWWSVVNVCWVGSIWGSLVFLILLVGIRVWLLGVLVGFCGFMVGFVRVCVSVILVRFIGWLVVWWGLVLVVFLLVVWGWGWGILVSFCGVGFFLCYVGLVRSCVWLGLVLGLGLCWLLLFWRWWRIVLNCLVGCRWFVFVDDFCEFVSFILVIVLVCLVISVVGGWWICWCWVEVGCWCWVRRLVVVCFRMVCWCCIRVWFSCLVWLFFVLFCYSGFWWCLLVDSCLGLVGGWWRLGWVGIRLVVSCVVFLWIGFVDLSW